MTSLVAAALIIGSTAQLHVADSPGPPQLECAAPEASRLVCRARHPFKRLGAVGLELVEATTATGVEIRLVILRSEGERVPLPRFYGNARWASCELVRDDADGVRADYVAIGDFNGDQHEDVAVLAECVTGIGPTGARPFLAGAVYFGDGAGGFTTADATNRALTRLASRSCRGGRCDVVALARAAVKESRRPGAGQRLSRSHEARGTDFRNAVERQEARRTACAATFA